MSRGRGRSVVLGVWAAGILVHAGSAHAAELDPTETATTPFRAVRPPRPVDLEPTRLVLSLPGEIAELAFVPLIPVIDAVERYHLADRAIDLFTNDELTFAAVPIVEPFNTSGLGVGALALQNDPLGSPDRTIALGLVRINGDRQLSLSVGRRLPSLSGRVLQVSGAYDVDRDIGWFGLGSDSTLADQRLLRRDELLVSVGLAELFPTVINVDGGVSASYRRRGLSTGSGSQAPPLQPDAGVSVPPGFGRTLNYAELAARFRYDTRDGLGRTTRGLVFTAGANGAHELSTEIDERRATGGLLATTQLTVFLPVLPRNRVLVLSAGASAAVPVFDGEDVALHQLVNLGGSDTLRGYQPDRFIDRVGWWSTVEYRFLLSDYGGSILGFSGALFADFGRVGRNVEDAVNGFIPWSVGLGLRAETDILLLGRAQIAISPDGFRVSVGVGEWF